MPNEQSAAPAANDQGGAAAPAAAPAANEGVDATGGNAPASQSVGAGEGAAPSGGGNDDWRSSIPEDIRNAPSVAGAKDIADLATQLVNAQGLVGNSIRIPSENASDEDRAVFRRKLQESVPGLAEVAASDPEAFAHTMRQLGAPEDAAGYSLPDFGEVQVEPVAGFNEWAHEANLTQAQFETIARRFTEQNIAAGQNQMAQHNADMEALSREWGYSFDARTTQAITAAERLNAPQDFIDAIKAGKVSPAWVKHYAELSDKFGDEFDVGQDRQNADARMTPAEAQSQYDEITITAESVRPPGPTPS